MHLSADVSRNSRIKRKKARKMLIFGHENSPEIRSIIDSEARRFSALATDLSRLAKDGTLNPFDGLFPQNPPVLEFWSLGFRRASCLTGLSSGHPILYGDRREIVTSDLVAFSEELGWARTRSRWYRLGQRSPSMSSN